ncbi:MAG: tripartite tricarboxylate transporter TctB family protein [Hyphomicrobiales bacterium]|uniref:tripartite tricarboxylate transporter TctB family protein n=1 Tax=Rhabdaerophilum calidifontis TaxID=2604328 RepID=UPI00140A308F|nr:tripartite tricarboxylate transporter TctB family protein [Rhabdaerophilum calidifontis]MCA1951539.1 tripartite tricarboxylate transporter TctB family protein [Hyphomicrobiales bacterium]MCA1999650.1 tripartite tricarboxylate transporter TctB family protein [Hyphomicrobiales bacterium]
MSDHRSQAARSPQDIVGGLALILIALLALYLVNHLPASGRVGFASGTAPRLFAYGLVGLGAMVMITGWMKEGPHIERFSFRGIIAILGSVVLFALMIRTFGLAVSGIPMVLLAGTAARDIRWKEALVFAIALTAFCGFLFPIALGQPIPLWPQF